MENPLTDQDILGMKKILPQTAADYLGMPRMAVCCGMRSEKLPIGVAKKEKGWTYHIIPERLVAYKNGTLIESGMLDIKRQLDFLLDHVNSLSAQFELLQRDIHNKSSGCVAMVQPIQKAT